MADVPNTTSSLNGLFKEVYGDGPKDLVPDNTKVQKLISFSSKEKQLGNKFHIPVLLAYEQGFTFAGPNAGAFSLNDAQAGVMKDATVEGCQAVLRAQMDYESAARSSKGKNAFIDGTKLMFENMQKSMRKRLEVQFLYGGSGLATVGSITGQVITITAAEFAPGIWSGMEGSSIDVMVGSTSGVRQASLKVASVDLDAGTVTVTGTVTGIAANDVIYYAGAYGNEMAGIYKILSNTGSLFGIDASNYTLWKASATSAGGALSQLIVNKAIAKATAKGLDDDLTLLVNPNAWSNLLTDQAALARHRSKEITMEVSNGSQEIKFFSQNGSVSVVPSIYVKAGHSIGVTPENWKRVGACDVSFKTPGYENEIFTQLQQKAGFEVRAYTNQAIICEAPAKNFLITGVVNS